MSTAAAATGGEGNKTVLKPVSLFRGNVRRDDESGNVMAADAS